MRKIFCRLSRSSGFLLNDKAIRASCGKVVTSEWLGLRFKSRTTKHKKVCFGGRANPSPPMSHSCTTRDSGAISDKIRFERMLCVFSVYYHSFGLIRNSISNDHKNFREIPLLQSRLRPSPPLLHSYRRGGLPDEGI